MGERDEGERLSEALVIAALTRGAEDYRQLDTLIWQIPTIALTVGSLVLAVATSTFVPSRWLSALVLFVGGFFELSLVISLSRHRVQQDVTSVYLERLERDYHLPRLPFHRIQMAEYLNAWDPDFEHATPGWFRSRRAFRWLWFSVLAMTLALFGSGLVELFIAISHP